MPNPFEFVRNLEEMNQNLCEKLDQIIARLDILIELADFHNQLDGGALDTERAARE